MLRISAGVALFAFVISLLAGSQGATEAITWVMVASIVVGERPPFDRSLFDPFRFA